eukprot:TRINITY_DN9958_c0_g1_i1.p1 TRINITY_DN9958_c0_g1~~TRINITY_DN9958_c0_g1_i1.p1  ORF type:complete len:890 (+),score=282.79 TRINITY_DN9958_c0_g1_i1:145-2814(+)
MLVFEEAQKRIEEVGGFSKKLEEVLLYLLKETQDIRETVTKENEARKGEIEKKCKDLERSFQDDSNRLKEIIKKENEERQRDMKDIEAYVKKENAERKKESNQISEKIKSDEEKRKEEAKALEDKIAKEKKELEEYLKKDALEHKQKMESENKAIKDKLDRDSTELKKKISDADDEKAEEMKILQNRLDNERKMLNDKMEREKAEIAEELERAAAERKTEANKLKNQLEEDKKQQENGVVQMFERLKGENENRKSEIHGLKDILVRENERLQNDQIALGNKLDAGLGELDDRLVRETTDCRKEMKKGTDGIIETINTDKKELKDKLDNEYTDLKRKVELETNDLRDKMQFDKKAMVQKFEEVEDERQKEAKLIRAQLQKEREETKDTISNETKMIQNQMDDNIRDLLDVVKKEKNDREKDVDHVKKRIEEEKEELQQTINRDRDNMTKKLNEEHDQRRIEQLEVQQRLENTEKSGKNDMVELFNRVKRYEEEARIDNDEVRQAITRTASGLEERVLRDKKELRELLDHEAADLSKRVDKCNLERINDSADVQGKIGMLGKSASRHLEHLKHALQRETQNLIELAGKPGSVMFSAYRDEGHADGGECYVTFSGCNVNLGNGFLPKSGMFQCPEPGMYLFSVTVCTYDGKKCLLILRKNEKDICALIDQDGNENRGKTMISQTCFLELDVSDRVQVYAVTGTGYTDTKSSHYTQFSGVLLRASQETFKAASRSLTEDEDVSIGEGSFRGFTPMRGFTPGPNGDISRRNSRKEPRRNNENRDVNKAMSPTPIDENRPVQNGHGSPEEKPVRKEKKKIPDPMEIKEESPTETEQNIPSQKVNGTLVDIEAPKGEKPQQSYLALTGLGGPDKKAEAKPNQGSSATSMIGGLFRR